MNENKIKSAEVEKDFDRSNPQYSETTGSVRGSLHWYRTIMARHLHMGEFLKDGKLDPTPYLKNWGEYLYKTSQEMIEWYNAVYHAQFIPVGEDVEQAAIEPISVEDYLPSEMLDILFYNSGYRMWIVGRLYDKNEKTFWDTSADTHTKVTHWLPMLPTPENWPKQWQASQQSSGEVNKRGFIDEIGLSGRDLELARAHNKQTHTNNGTVYDGEQASLHTQQDKSVSYTKEQVIEMVRKRLIEVYGRIESTGYTTIGIINDSFPNQ